VSKYKYLGVLLDELLYWKANTEILVQSGGRALGGIIYKFRSMKDISYSTKI
jgi:hypothetical protein